MFSAKILCCYSFLYCYFIYPFVAFLFSCVLNYIYIYIQKIVMNFHASFASIACYQVLILRILRYSEVFSLSHLYFVPATLAVYHYLDLLPHCLITFSPLNFVNIFLSSWLSHLQSHMVHVVHELNCLKLNFFLTDEKFLMLTCHVGYIRKS